MSDYQDTPGHWQASDGKWYPPETHPDYVPPAPIYEPAPPVYEPAAPPAAAPRFEPSSTVGGLPPTQQPAFPSSTAPQTVSVPVPPSPAPVAPSPPGTAWWQQWWMIGLAVVLVGGGIGAFIATRGDDGDTVAGAEDTVARTGTDEPSANEPSTDDTNLDQPGSDSASTDSAESTAEINAGDVTDSCSYLGVDFVGDMQVELQFAHEGPPTDLIVSYAMLDSTGSEFASGTELVQYVRTGDVFRIESDSLESVPSNVDENEITCAITEFDEFGVNERPSPPAPSDDCRVVEVDFVGDIQVEVSVTNPLADAANLTVPIALRAEGIRFADATAFADGVPPGGMTTQRADSLAGLPPGVTLGEVSCQVLAVDSFG